MTLLNGSILRRSVISAERAYINVYVNGLSIAAGGSWNWCIYGYAWPFWHILRLCVQIVSEIGLPNY